MCSGNYTITHEIAQVGVPTFGGHNEGGMAFAADGYARASGLVTACSGTEGPGFTNMITAIATAHFANTPLLVLASNRTLASEDSYKAIQYIVQQNQTEGLRKYGKRITTPERIYEYGSYAFRHLKSGVPGVAHLDFPAEIADARFTDPAKLINYYDGAKYRTRLARHAQSGGSREGRGDDRQGRAAGHRRRTRRPCPPCPEALLRAAEKNDIGVISSGPVRGIFPDEHRLSLSMANDALKQADLVIFIGQYLMPSPGEWTMPTRSPPFASIPKSRRSAATGRSTSASFPTKAISSRRWPMPCRRASAKPGSPKSRPPRKPDGHPDGLLRTAWPIEIHRRLHPAVLSKDLHDFLYKGAIDPKQTLTGYGGLTMAAMSGTGFAPTAPLRKSSPTTSSARWVPRSP